MMSERAQPKRPTERKMRVAAAVNEILASSSSYDQMYDYEKAIFNYFQFDPEQFEKRVQLDIDIKEHPEKTRTFNTADFMYYFVPKILKTSASKPPSPSSLQKKLNELNYISSNPTIAFFRMDKASQDAVRKNDASEFAGVPTPTPEEIRQAIWNDLIHSAVHRAILKTRFRAAPAAGGRGSAKRK